MEKDFDIEKIENNQALSMIDEEKIKTEEPLFYEGQEELERIQKDTGLTYKAPKPAVEPRTITIDPDIKQKLQGDFYSAAGNVFEKIYDSVTGNPVAKELFSGPERFVAGIIDGNIKLIKNPISIVASLIDAFEEADKPVDKGLTAQFDQFFKNTILGKVGTEAENIAFESAVGKLTSGFTQIFGGTKAVELGLKKGLDAVGKARDLTNKYFKAVKEGNVVHYNSKIDEGLKLIDKVNKLSPAKKKVLGIIGTSAAAGAGMALFTDADEMGTISNLLRGTSLFGVPLDVFATETKKGLTSQEEAERRIGNQLKLFTETGLITAPMIIIGGKIANIFAKQTKDVAASDEALGRWIEKYLVSPLRARGLTSQELFEETQRVKNVVASGQVTAKDMIIDIDQLINKISKDAGIRRDTPEIKKLVGKLDELLTSGGGDVVKNNKIVFQGFNNKAITDFKKFTKQELNLNLEQSESLIASLFNVRNKFNEFKNTFFQGGNFNIAMKEFNKIMSQRMINQWTSDYRIFNETFKYFPLLSYKPTQEKLDAAKTVLFDYAKRNGVRITPEQVEQDLIYILQNVKKDPVKVTPIFPITNRSVLSDKESPIQLVNIGKYFEGGKFKPGEFFRTEEQVKIFQRLFGQQRDLRNSIINTMYDLSMLTTKDKFYNNILKINNELAKKSRPQIIFNTPDDAVKGLKNVIGSDELPVKINIKSTIDDVAYANPLNGKFTSPVYNEALNLANDIALGAIARNAVYQHLILIPKGATQISKTILGPFTHTRNFTTAGTFTIFNGNAFKDPKKLATFAKEAWSKIQPQLRSRNLPKDQSMYKWLLENGVTSTSATAKDLFGLLDDMSRTTNFYATLYNKFAASMKRLTGGKDILGLETARDVAKKIYIKASDLYVAEDDFWKIFNFFAEVDNYKTAYAKAHKAGRIKNMPDDLFFWNKSAEIIRNTIPNYAYVGKAVQTLRKSPLGNFMAWPSEIIRTGFNTLRLGVQEYKDPIMRAQGAKRLTTFAGGLSLVIPGIGAALQGLYGVTDKTVAAARKFVPDFSKSNTLFFTRDDKGDLYYIDGSGALVYDTLTGPAQSIISQINVDTKFDPKSELLPSITKGMINGLGKLMEPFISESIWFETINNLFIRKGRTSEGKQIFNPQDLDSVKVEKSLKYFIEQVAPFSLKQSERLYKAISNVPGERGEKYNVSHELMGFYGLRPVKLDVIKSMDYLIGKYQGDIANVRQLFTVPITKGGVVNEEEYIKNFYYANKQKYDLMSGQKTLHVAAKELNVKEDKLYDSYDARGGKKLFNQIQDGYFVPFPVSKGIREKQENVREQLLKGDFSIPIPNNLSGRSEAAVDKMRDKMSNLKLNQNFEELINLNDYLPSKSFKQSGSLPIQPQPDQQIISQPQQQTTEGLTSSELALLRPDEKVIKLKRLGLL